MTTRSALIAFDRPGLGSFDTHPDKTLSSWVDDIEQLILDNDLDNTEHLNLQPLG